MKIESIKLLKQSGRVSFQISSPVEVVQDDLPPISSFGVGKQLLRSICGDFSFYTPREKKLSLRLEPLFLSAFFFSSCPTKHSASSFSPFPLCRKANRITVSSFSSSFFSDANSQNTHNSFREARTVFFLLFPPNSTSSPG